MSKRRKSSKPNGLTNGDLDHDHDHDHDHSHDHGGIFHSHSHGDHEHGDQTAEAVVKLLQGQGLDKGTKVTVLGIFTNVGLTAVKGAAGWYFHSAALLAEAGHSMSDLLADFVTLACWRTSRRPPTENYPLGFGKFETFGTATVSIILVAAALAIGHHSFSTVLHVIEPTIQAMPAGTAHDVLSTIISANMTALDAVRDMLPHNHVHGHSHSHGHSDIPAVELVSINAAWFAFASVLVKEWIYRLTKKVADEEKSPVLAANALHHRSDAYSSAVALLAIVGSWAVPGLPLDALGGTLISIMIFQQGFGMLRGSLRDLADAGVSQPTLRSLTELVQPLVGTSIHSIRHVKAVRSGSLVFVDLTADVSPSMTMREAHVVEDLIRSTIKSARREVREVRVHLHPQENGKKEGNGDAPC